MRHCPLRAPKCPPASKRYRTHDGTCNNLNRPRWGSTMTPVQRFLAPSYSDGLQAPRRSVFGGKLPSAREISSHIHESKNVESPGITHLLMQWGQFVDHDITSSSQTRGFNGSVPRCCKDGGRGFVPKELLHPECFPIEVSPSDPFYGPRGVRCLDFVRSSPAPRDDCSLGWREQLNQVSAYIDGSPLYASSARQSDKLRLFRNGMLQYGRVQQRRPLLPPERHDELCRGGAVSTDCFKSGDARVNEQPGLVAAHIVWLRQHNRMAQELAHLNPHWSDEKIYQETRKIVGAMIQHITYREFLPIILGTEVMRLFELELLKKGYYKDYNPKTNASPASSFASAAFRFGHSLVQSSMVRYDRFHRPMNNNVSLHNEVTNPSNIWSMGAVDRLLLGMVNQPIQKRDEFITEELTNHLFQTPQFDFGMDLAAINIQRGRDHGVPPYTSWREPCGLSPILEFEDLFRVMPARAMRKLKSLYRHVDDIDLFTGGMSERPVIGGLVGPTFACIIAQQFSNLRKGDRFWYENGGFESSFTPAQLQQIRRISFAQVLCHTLDNIDSIQPFVFLSPDNPDNDRISCHNGLLNNFDLSAWVELSSDSNDIKKSDDEPSTQKPKRTKPTTTTQKPTTTKPKKTQQLISSAGSTHMSHKIPSLNLTSSNKLQNITDNKLTDKLNKTNTMTKEKANNATLTVDKNNMKANLTAQKIDDKLDFKNKSRRYDDERIHLRHDIRPQSKPTNKYNDYDYEERDHDIQNVQSVVINNLPHKRPYNRPIITVTENVNKYTYLINYVPRPTESWRRTTKRNYDGEDVVKVTYQTYDDTYRRPNKPYYYNRRDDLVDDNYYDKPKHKSNPHSAHLRDNLQSSARSNDETVRTTAKTTTTTDKFDDTLEYKSTTENLYKLVTFGYVGSYKGSDTNTRRITNIDKSDKNELKHDIISKDFTTYVTNKPETLYDNDKTNMRLSTFFMYETATKPYLQRPTRRHDENRPVKTKNKYYYIQNVLHKYPEPDTTGTDKQSEIRTDILKENHNYSGVGENIEERSSADKLALLHEIESKSNNHVRQRVKVKKPTSPAKTPSVAFQVIPSENSPMQWAVYEEIAELSEDFPHRMPPIKTDPHALKEIPRPMNLKSLRRRRPGMF
ncbi:chorion peroxidase-like [Galleria mellonella]|uniref:Chorion peroxidase-like n=1 Tax=Galleria mellonella TaxID=7137 RepID=A0A6J3BV36_GALME|nr:chorion peroxidase-like [Galleria mellonella]